ncbi:MAG: GNAT family N-acetyltransferase [Verrucomicrobiota bacterium JB022]|nr:GNAT family N-acetyltransferase [Verrucomicrobiota bacterium JB022]
MPLTPNAPAPEIEIIDFRPEHAVDFARISFGWIKAYFSIEPADLEVLNHPQAHILDRGGHILLARLDDTIVGCIALVPAKSEPGWWEISKMGVDERARSRGIGRLLMLAVLERAREIGARQLFLETNSRLAPALRLYEQAGFVKVPMRPSPYTRADVRMELVVG